MNRQLISEINLLLLWYSSIVPVSQCLQKTSFIGLKKNGKKKNYYYWQSLRPEVGIYAKVNTKCSTCHANVHVT